MNAQILSLLLISFINCLGTSIAYPLMAPLFLAPETPFATSWGFSSPMVLLMVTLAIYPLGQFLGSPLLGYISDKRGAKFTLSWSLSFTVIGYLISAYAVCFGNLLLLLLSRFLTGVMEGNFGIVRSIAANLTEGKQRLTLFSYINAAFTSGWLVGPLVGGFFSDSTMHAAFTPYLPFLIAAGIAGFSLGLVLWTVPQYSGASAEHQSFMESMRGIVGHKNLALLIACSFFVTLSIDAFYEFYPVLLVERWGFSPSAIAGATTCLCVAMVITQAFLLPRTQVRPYTYLAAGMLYASALCLVVACLLPAWVYLLFLLAGVGNAYLGVLLPAYISEISPKENHGSTMGVLVATRCLGDALVCLLMGGVASISIDLPILLAAVSAMVGVVPFYRSVNRRNRLLTV